MTAQNSNLDKIEHIIVLVMENRSFDNILGWLYPDNPDFRGVNSTIQSISKRQKILNKKDYRFGFLKRQCRTVLFR